MFGGSRFCSQALINLRLGMTSPLICGKWTCTIIPSFPVSLSRTFVTRYPGLPILRKTLRWTEDWGGATASWFSFMSRAARRARLVWCFLPCVCARYEPSFVWSVRQRRHSSEPRWLRRMYGSYEFEYLSFVQGVKVELRTHLGQVNGFQGQLPQTFSPIHICLRGTSDTSTTEL